MSNEVKANKRKKDVCTGSYQEDLAGGEPLMRAMKKKIGSPRKRNKKERHCRDEEKTEEKEELECLSNNEGKDSSDEEESGFLLLPDEVWLMIFSYLSLIEKARCGMVCHHFWKWSSDRILYRTLDFSPYPERVGSYRLTTFASQPKTVDAEVLILKGCTHVSDSAIDYVTSRWGKLAVVDLEGCSEITELTLRLIEMRCPRLKAVNVIGCDIYGFNPILKLLQSCKRPLDLHVSGHTCQGGTYPEFKSRVSKNTTAITFSNQTDKAVEVVWVDFDGDTKVYHRLKPGDFYSQHTFETHYWLMREIAKPDNILLHTVGTTSPHIAEAVSPAVPSDKTLVHNLLLPSSTVPVPVCVPAGKFCSTGEKKGGPITFMNTTDKVLLIYWVDSDGKEVFKGEVGADAEVEFESCSSHAWRVRDKLTHDTWMEAFVTTDSTVVEL